jgi:hypothetical protein
MEPLLFSLRVFGDAPRLIRRDLVVDRVGAVARQRLQVDASDRDVFRQGE